MLALGAANMCYLMNDFSELVQAEQTVFMVPLK